MEPALLVLWSLTVILLLSALITQIVSWPSCNCPTFVITCPLGWTHSCGCAQHSSLHSPLFPFRYKLLLALSFPLLQLRCLRLLLTLGSHPHAGSVSTVMGTPCCVWCASPSRSSASSLTSRSLMCCPPQQLWNPLTECQASARSEGELLPLGASCTH